MKGRDAMEQETPLYLQFHQALLRAKHLAHKLPPPCDGLTNFEYMTLNMLYNYLEEHPELPGMQVSLLSDATHLSRSAISQHIKLMEERNLVERISSRTDRRVTYLILTDTAIAHLRRHEETHLARLRAFCERLGEADTRTIIAITNRMSEIFREIREETSGTAARKEDSHG